MTACIIKTRMDSHGIDSLGVTGGEGVSVNAAREPFLFTHSHVSPDASLRLSSRPIAQLVARAAAGFFRVHCAARLQMLSSILGSGAPPTARTKHPLCCRFPSGRRGNAFGGSSAQLRSRWHAAPVHSGCFPGHRRPFRIGRRAAFNGQIIPGSLPGTGSYRAAQGHRKVNNIVSRMSKLLPQLTLAYITRSNRTYLPRQICQAAHAGCS